MSPRRNPNGAGSITGDDERGYRVTFRWVEGGRQVRKQYRARTRRDAERIRRDPPHRRENRPTGSPADAPRTVTDLIAAWLESKNPQSPAGELTADERSVSLDTWRDYRAQLTDYILPRLGSKPLTTLASSDIRQAFADIAQQTSRRGGSLSWYRQRNIWRVFSMVLTAAERAGYIARNPMRRMRAPSAPNVRNAADTAVLESPRLRALSAEEVRRVMAHAETLGTQALVRWHLGLYVGLRQSECLGIVWDNVKVSRNEILIDRQLYRQTWMHGCDDESCGRRPASCPSRHGGGLRVVRTTKTNQIRTVPITDDIAQGLSNLYEEQQEQREKAGERWQEQSDWKGLVFRRPWGAPISPSDDWRQWQEMTQTVLGRRARVHDARHSSATLMIDAGAPLTAVRDVLGHSRIDMTSRYVGTASEAAHDAIRAVTRSLSGRG